MIIGYIFTALKAFLTLVGLWDQFQDWSRANTIKNRDDENQKLDQAVDELKNAKTEDDFDKAQSSIVSHLPRP